jgi:hypothetical protein
MVSRQQRIMSLILPSNTSYRKSNILQTFDKRVSLRPFFIVGLLTCFALILLRLIYAFEKQPLDALGYETLSTRSVGNAAVAQDIYGIGVRVGFYLQAVSGILSGIRPMRDPSGGVPLFFSIVVSIAILVSWTRLAAQRSISPAETIVIMHMVATNLSTSAIGYINSGFRGNGMGLVVTNITSLWLVIASLWFYIVGRKTLPRLGTENKTWFFVKVNINGWVGTFLTVMNVLGAVEILFAMWRVFFSCWALSVWWWGDSQNDENWVNIIDSASFATDT